MEILQVLEEKITTLVSLVKKLTKEKEQLHKDVLAQKEQNQKLIEQIEMLESSLLDDKDHLKELNEEKELTKTVVDDLIKNIDALVESGNEPS